jgi:hypothetical protein
VTQSQAILDHLRSHPAGLTQADAIRLFGCYRLAARISDIRNGMLERGESLPTIVEPHDGGTHARYVLVRGNGGVLFENVPDYVRFADSPHKRHGHPKPVPGCEWCIRIAAGNAVFEQTPEPVVTEDDAEPLTLFDCGEAA